MLRTARLSRIILFLNNLLTSSFLRAELERSWMKITDDSTKAAAIIDLQISKQEQYDAKNLQLKTFRIKGQCQ